MGKHNIKVVFVCLGNICRSPMAEVVFRHMVEEEGLEDLIEIDSAATSSWEHGNPVHPGTVQVLAAHGLSAKGLFSRPLDSRDLVADYVIGMDQSNMKNIHKWLGSVPEDMIVAKLLDYTPKTGDIADPWYTGDFDQTYSDVVAGCQGLLTSIKARIRGKESDHDPRG